MGTLALLAWLTAASTSPQGGEPEPEVVKPVPSAIESAPAEVELEAPPPEGERWAHEERRVHWGVGVRGHVGALVSLNSPQLLAHSGVFGVLSLRTRGHEELRVQLELNVGIPDLFGGESNVSYRFHLTPKLSVGGGLFVFVGAPSIRAGIEVPFGFLIGPSRRHELGASLRLAAGVFNNSTFVWYDFSKQRFALSAEVTVGYTFLF